MWNSSWALDTTAESKEAVIFYKNLTFSTAHWRDGELHLSRRAEQRDLSSSGYLGADVKASLTPVFQMGFIRP